MVLYWVYMYNYMVLMVGLWSVTYANNVIISWVYWYIIVKYIRVMIIYIYMLYCKYNCYACLMASSIAAAGTCNTARALIDGELVCEFCIILGFNLTPLVLPAMC